MHVLILSGVVAIIREPLSTHRVPLDERARRSAGKGRGVTGRKLLRRLLADDKFRFLVVGGVNTGVGFLLFIVFDLTVGRPLDAAGHSIVASVLTLLLSHLLASLLAFWLYRRFVFRVSGHAAIDFVRFQGVYAVPLAINLVVLPLLVELGVMRIVAQGSILIVTTVFSYVGHRFFSFRRKGAPARDPLAEVFAHDPQRGSAPGGSTDVLPPQASAKGEPRE